MAISWIDFRVYLRRRKLKLLPCLLDVAEFCSSLANTESQHKLAVQPGVSQV